MERYKKINNKYDIYFSRREGGYVGIEIINWTTNIDYSVASFIMDPIQWVAIIAQVSENGCTDNKFQEAIKFHGTEGYSSDYVYGDKKLKEADTEVLLDVLEILTEELGEY